MPLKFRKPTKEQEREIIIKSLVKNLVAIADDEARLIAALEWTTDDEVAEALVLMSDENALKVCIAKEKLLAAKQAVSRTLFGRGKR